jgi:hypothetical protein
MQRGRARTTSAPPFPGTSGLAASKSAAGNSTPRSRRLTSHSQGARNDEGWRNRSSALGKAFRSGGTESSNPTLGYFGTSKNLSNLAIFGEGTKGVLSQVLSPKGRTEDKGWCDVLQVTRRDPRKSFYSPRRATASCRMAHPRRRKLWKLSARPGGKGRSRRVWRAMDQGAESGDRYHPQPA